MLPINLLWTLLFFFILLSSFFSLAETAYMSVNKYRLRHLARKNHSHAKRAQKLLERPDRLLGVVLLGDTLSDILASAVSTLIAIHYFGSVAVFPVTLILTFLVLIFGELTPKTLAARYAVQIVLYTAWILEFLLIILYPIIWLINLLSNGLLRLCGVGISKNSLEHLSSEELRTIVAEASPSLSSNKQRMLLQLFDLEKIYVEDLMIPRHEIIGINLDQPWSDIKHQIMTGQHTRLPLYHEHIENIIGMLHVRDVLNYLAEEELTHEKLEVLMEDPYFIPEGTSLSLQLLTFCQQKKRTGLVVDEYGSLLGLVTLEDILEEIVGEFTTNIAGIAQKDILLQKDGGYLLDGGITLRHLNRTLNLQFSLEGPKTLSGLIIEYLEMIPPANVCVRIAGYPLEILQVKDNMVKTVKLLPPTFNTYAAHH